MRTYENACKENTYILCQQICTSIIILIQANIPTLVAQWPPAALVCVRSAHRVAGSHTDLGLGIRAVVNVQPEHILLGRRVVQHLGAFHDAVRAEIARRRLREQRTDVGPGHQVRRRVTVDVLEGRAVCLVLADEIVRAADFDDACAVRLYVGAGVGLFQCGALAPVLFAAEI